MDLPLSIQNHITLVALDAALEHVSQPVHCGLCVTVSIRMFAHMRTQTIQAIPIQAIAI